MTNKLLQICASVCISVFLVFDDNQVNASTTCGPTSTAGAHTGVGNAANGEDKYCFTTPDVLQLKFYEFGLCTGNASPTNRVNCTPIFKSPSGRDVNVSKRNVADLLKQATLTEGTYTHGYLIVSNTVEINLTMEFSAARTDDDGLSGKYCFTDGRSINSSNSIMSCDNSPLPRSSPETMALNGCGVDILQVFLVTSTMHKV